MEIGLSWHLAFRRVVPMMNWCSHYWCVRHIGITVLSWGCRDPPWIWCIRKRTYGYMMIYDDILCIYHACIYIYYASVANLSCMHCIWYLINRNLLLCFFLCSMVLPSSLGGSCPCLIPCADLTACHHSFLIPLFQIEVLRELGSWRINPLIYIWNIPMNPSLFLFFYVFFSPEGLGFWVSYRWPAPALPKWPLGDFSIDALRHQGGGIKGDPGVPETTSAKYNEWNGQFFDTSWLFNVTMKKSQSLRGASS
jgi:hypothetical protein